MDEVTIRELTPDDEGAVGAWSADDRVAGELPFGPGPDVAAWIASTVADAAEVPRSSWTLAVDAGSERAVGVVVLSIDSRHDARAEVGFVVRADRWGRGIASAAVAALVELAFDDVGLHRLWAVCGPDNLGACRVLERNGFELEGRLRDDRSTPGGWRDSLLFGRVAGRAGD